MLLRSILDSSYKPPPEVEEEEEESRRGTAVGVETGAAARRREYQKTPTRAIKHPNPFQKLISFWKIIEEMTMLMTALRLPETLKVSADVDWIAKNVLQLSKKAKSPLMKSQTTRVSEP